MIFLLKTKLGTRVGVLKRGETNHILRNEIIADLPNLPEVLLLTRRQIVRDLIHYQMKK
jgi:hypothetical protein